jgi:hypothetical protein
VATVGAATVLQLGELTMSELVPTAMSYHDLADLLLDMSQRVREGDSLEGNIEYFLVDDNIGDIAGHLVYARGMYRTGNQQGQGGMRVIGTFD